MVTRERPAGDVDYERQGRGYAALRRTEPRIAARVHAALGDARTVLDVGAGSGSYEPADRWVLAVEPSAAMRAQRPAGAAPALDATAEHLPFDDDAFDAAMAMVTIHQWPDVDRGLRELRRVSRGPVVVLTHDAPALRRFWLAEYFPDVVALDETRFPTIDHVVDVLAAAGGTVRVDVVPIPRDCVDGFGEAFWARPEAYLRAEVRGATSGFVLADQAAVQRGVERLAADLESGAWDRAHGHLREQDEYAGAMRLVVATP
ncbi:Methyltransferase type 11 [Cellulomonas flavigena DSM 20109]|uniref:Methyltransferase type 11 n=1 Tax=Cellulomonas flavigena (strain ATCC 482 / DSM 20109 / BCRC 11376 / JCM 18109 / NBRC 3775 / NCIMB 8073 / NRS 134) TaxID=446466 RepID=D5UH51_CELFN|nr:methyltransferase domain-containing protein [Cellulomonas flavigena]ADG73254.1 Methyltransferase type 11 [Cellulomonas flavigena DSM 20109]